MVKQFKRYKFEVTFLSAAWLCAAAAIVFAAAIGL
jgi:hypothetical protein